MDDDYFERDPNLIGSCHTLTEKPMKVPKREFPIGFDLAPTTKPKPKRHPKRTPKAI